MLQEYPENRTLFGDHPLFPKNPLRDWIRKHIPSPRDGYVAEDLDLIFLRYGKAIGKNKNDDGQFILCEWKLNNKELPYAQQRVFGLLDRLLRKADPFLEYYKGFYHIVWDGKKQLFYINGYQLTHGQFQDFLIGKLDIDPKKPLKKSQ